ncbi:MAG: hypothetical protein ACJ75B_20890 [Flavisolibacter sp.]|jgi:hypothetical protein
MAFSTMTNHPVSAPAQEHSVDHTAAASLLSMLVLSVYAAQKTNKKFRQLKRRYLWTAFKLKMKSMFSKRAANNDRILIYILLGVVALVLVFYYPIIALILAVVALILILTGTI